LESTESIDQFVIKTIAAICQMEDSQITLVAPLSEFALNSLDITVLAVHIQATYDCIVTAEDMIGLLEAPRVADVVAIVRRATERPTLPES
jgi:acyl carrier protein